jgi:nitrous oxidase accessory protein NosD
MGRASNFWRSALALWVTLASGCTGGADAKTIRANPDTLQDALLRAAGGDRIVLAPAQYGEVTWTQRTFKPAVTIDATQARFTQVTIRGVNGLMLSGGTIAGPRDHTWDMRVDFSQNITVRGMRMSGARVGIGFSRSSDVVAERNEFDGIRSDGINLASVQRAKILFNDCRNFTPVPGVYTDKGKSLHEGDHPDCIQGWAIAGAPGPADITIIGNTARGLMQGIFLSDPADRGYDRLTIRDNNMQVAMYHGIVVVEARDSIITGNTVRAVPGARMLTFPFHPVTPWIKAANSQRTLICGNTIETPRASQDIGPCPASLKLPPIPRPVGGPLPGSD